MLDLSLSLSLGTNVTGGTSGKLTIGNAGLVFGYSQGNFGAIEPGAFNGIEIDEFTCDLADLLVIRFVGNQQVPGFSTIEIAFPSYVSNHYDIPWDQTNTRYQALFAGLTDYFTTNDGLTVPFHYRLKA